MIMSSLHVDPQELVKTVVLENERKEEELQTSLEYLDKNFSVLMIAVRSALDHKLQHQQLVLVDFIRWIEHRMNWVGELSNVIYLDELLKKLHPYFDFLDCGLIVDMSEHFLNDKWFGDKDLVSQLKEHKVKGKSLRSSSTVKQLRDDLKKIYFPHHTNPSNMPHIYIALNSTWDEVNIKQLYLLIGHLLPHKSKQSILKHIEIHAGSVIIKYIVYESNAECLIAYAQSKLQFMRLIGIFGLTINGEPILKEEENMNFTFESALLQAANVGHIEAIQFLLKLGCNVNVKDTKGWTALIIACQKGHMQVIEHLLKEHADVNIPTNYGWTALMIASQKGHMQFIEHLLKEHADVNVQTNDGWTALMIASHYADAQVIEQLLKEHADVNLQNKEGTTSLMLASQSGRTQVVEQLLKEHADINLCNKEGTTSLMLASQNGHVQVMEQLLKEHADVNLQNKEGVTALMLASKYGYTQVIEQLLKEHAGINLQNKDSVTALMIASKYGHTQVVEQLLKEHAYVNIQTNEGWTALMVASQNGHTEVVEQLLKEDADVNIQNQNGVSALMLASENGHTQVVEAILKELVDIDVKIRGNGYTALMLASIKGHVEVADCLLQSFADPHIISYNGLTAFSLAAFSGNRDLVNTFLDKAEPTTDEIEKAVVTSCYGGHPSLITFLSNKLTHVTNDQKELLDSCVKGDVDAVVLKTLDSPDPDTPLVLGLTPLMIASSCGHVDIVDVLLQAGADVNKQESTFGFTPLFFAVKGGKSSLITDTLLMYGAHPNIIIDSHTPLDIAIYMKEETISKILISYGGQTRSQLHGKRKSEFSELRSSLPTLGEEVIAKSLLTTDDITMYEESSYTLKKEVKVKSLETPSFTSLKSSFT